MFFPARQRSRPCGLSDRREALGRQHVSVDQTEAAGFRDGVRA